MFCEVVGGDEGQDAGLEAFQVVVVAGFDGSIRDGAVYAFGQTVGPGVVRFGQPVLDAVGDTNAVEDMRSKEAAAGPIARCAAETRGSPATSQNVAPCASLRGGGKR